MNRPTAGRLLRGDGGAIFPVVLATTLAAALCGDPPGASPSASLPFIGQWVWTPQDTALFLRSRIELPDIEPAVRVSTLSFANGALRQSLGLSPAVEPGARAAIVIRFDTSVDGIWSSMDDAAVAASIDTRLRRLLEPVSKTGVEVAEVQLDYDCPVRLLPRWASVVGILSGGALAGRTVWITSLVDHIRQPDYGDLFRGRVAGHILQVFDTGEQLLTDSPVRVAILADQQRMPFRLGLGAFERKLPGGGRTDHRGWFEAIRPIGRSPWFRGVWVFPAGQPWVSLVRASL